MDKIVIQIDIIAEKMISSISSNKKASDSWIRLFLDIIDDYNFHEIGFKSHLMNFENPWSFCEIGLA